MSRQYPRFKVIAVLPAYNAAKTLVRTVADIPAGWVDEIVLVDDVSRDGTVAVAQALGLRVLVHPQNRGYGGNQKTCYDEALKLGADIVVMVHPDHQYDPRLVPDLLLPILRGDAEVVFGSRMMRPGAARAGGMPWWKYLANIGLTKLANLALGLRLTEYHSGFRAYSRHALLTVDYKQNSDDFIFDTEIIIQLVAHGIGIQEVPITTRYFPEASMISFKRSVVYGFGILRSLTNHVIRRFGSQSRIGFVG